MSTKVPFKHLFGFYPNVSYLYDAYSLTQMKKISTRVTLNITWGFTYIFLIKGAKKKLLLATFNRFWGKYNVNYANKADVIKNTF